MRARKTILTLSSAVRTQVLARPPPPILLRHHATYNTNTTHPQSTTTSSVNPSEVTHFTALASSWWDPHGPSRLLHLMNPLRHDFLRRCLRTSHATTTTADELPQNALRVLDIGCGGGIFAESAARAQWVESVTAIDPTPEVIAVARRHARADPGLGEGRLRYVNCSIEELGTQLRESEDEKMVEGEGVGARKEAQFDVVTVFEVVEHIRKPGVFLREALRHLKPGGWLVGSTIARTGTSWFTTKFVAEDVLRMVPRGTHDWNQYIQPSELKAWAVAQDDLEARRDGGWAVMGVVYVPGVGWREVNGSEDWGNYFFAVRKSP